MIHPGKETPTVSIPLPPDDVVAKVIGDSYNPEKTLNVIKMFAGTDDMYASTIGLVKAVFQAEGIDLKAREMIILRSAKLLNCPYEWLANSKFASNAGLSNDEIAAASSDGAVTGIDPQYVFLCKATDELTATGTLTDQTLTEMLSRYGDTISRKFILMIAWFNLLPRFLNGCRVPLETTDKIGGGTSPI
jgi:alkylhydroperoxidase family enzyme